MFLKNRDCCTPEFQNAWDCALIKISGLIFLFENNNLQQFIFKLSSIAKDQMNKLLTIAIPTYIRAELLDKQLAWL